MRGGGGGVVRRTEGRGVSCLVLYTSVLIYWLCTRKPSRAGRRGIVRNTATPHLGKHVHEVAASHIMTDKYISRRHKVEHKR